MSQQLKMLRYTALTGLLLLLSACSLTPASPPSPTLESLPSAGPLTQQLSFERNGETQVLIGVLRHDKEHLQLTLLSPQGQRLLTLLRDQSGARFLPGAVFEPPFSADWLASRISWSLWSQDQLVDSFTGSGWSLIQTGQERQIYKGRQLIARISIMPSCQAIEDIEAGYRLTMTSLDTASPTDATIDNKEAAAPLCPSM